MHSTTRRTQDFLLPLILLLAMSIAPAVIASAQAGVLEDVREQFNKDKGVPRLVVLVSPT